jgi:hypothetical protein
MRVSRTVASLCALLLAAVPLKRVEAQQPASPGPAVTRRPVLVGRVVDSTTGGAVQGVSIEVRSTSRDSFVGIVVADTIGTFVVELPRGGRYSLFAKRLGYSPAQRTFTAAGDTITVLIPMVSAARTLAPVVVTTDAVMSELRSKFRAMDHARLYSAEELEHSGQLLAGAFLLGQGGINTVSCGRSKQFLPAGKVRTVPVEREPADVWWPCVMVRDKTVPVRISIDGGPAEPFATISDRELSRFAMIAVVRGGAFVYAYSQDYVATRSRGRY